VQAEAVVACLPLGGTSVAKVEGLFKKKSGPWYKSRLMWAGDHANEEADLILDNENVKYGISGETNLYGFYTTAG